ncbi:MAG: hypothetical protein V1744_07245 [Candidatus Altiarchaeota archaeon]
MPQVVDSREQQPAPPQVISPETQETTLSKFGARNFTGRTVIDLGGVKTVGAGVPISGREVVGLLGPNGKPIEEFLEGRIPSGAERLAEEFKRIREGEYYRKDFEEVASYLKEMIAKGRVDTVEEAMKGADIIHPYDSTWGTLMPESDRLGANLDRLFCSFDEELSGEARLKASVERARVHLKNLAGLREGATPAERKKSIDYFMDNITPTFRKGWTKEKLDSLELIPCENEPYVAVYVKGDIPNAPISNGVTGSFGESDIISPLIIVKKDGPHPFSVYKHEAEHVKTNIIWGGTLTLRTIEDEVVGEICSRLSEGKAYTGLGLFEIAQYYHDMSIDLRREFIKLGVSSKEDDNRIMNFYEADVANYDDEQHGKSIWDGRIKGIIEIDELVKAGVPSSTIIDRLRTARTLKKFAESYESERRFDIAFRKINFARSATRFVEEGKGADVMKFLDTQLGSDTTFIDSSIPEEDRVRYRLLKLESDTFKDMSSALYDLANNAGNSFALKKAEKTGFRIPRYDGKSGAKFTTNEEIGQYRVSWDNIAHNLSDEADKVLLHSKDLSGKMHVT